MRSCICNPNASVAVSALKISDWSQCQGKQLLSEAAGSLQPIHNPKPGLTILLVHHQMIMAWSGMGFRRTSSRTSSWSNAHLVKVYNLLTPAVASYSLSLLPVLQQQMICSPGHPPRAWRMTAWGLISVPSWHSSLLAGTCSWGTGPRSQPDSMACDRYACNQSYQLNFMLQRNVPLCSTGQMEVNLYAWNPGGQKAVGLSVPCLLVV